MIDLKYHVYSLVAVFVALAAGVVIGIGIAGGAGGQASAIEKQRQAITELRDRFRQYSDELGRKQASMEDLVGDLKDVDTLVGGILPALVEGTLSARNVAVVQMGAAGDVSRLQRTIAAAGGVVTSVTRINTDFEFADAKRMAGAAQAVPREFQQTDKPPQYQVWGFVASTLAGGREGNPLDPLAGAGILEPSGDYSRPCNLVVILSPAGEDARRVVEMFGGALLARLRSQKLRVVAASPSMAQQEAVENPWHELDVPTASHSDYAMGQVCIVEALMQGEGRYGLGPSQSILPNRLLRR